MRRCRRGCRSAARRGSGARQRSSPNRFPRRGSRPAWRGTSLVSGHFHRPDLRCVCCRSAALDIRSSTQSTCERQHNNCQGTGKQKSGGKGGTKVEGGSGRDLLCVLAEAFLGEHERVRQSRKDHIERLAEERGRVLGSMSGYVSITFAGVTTMGRR